MPAVRPGRSAMAHATAHPLRRPAAAAALLLLGLGPWLPAAAAPLPYPAAVLEGRQAAEAVLAGAGAESCLRGKMTRALLRLSDSCAVRPRPAGNGEAGGGAAAEAAGAALRSPELCALADRAVVVTPMSLPFLKETARQLLNLSTPGAGGS